MTTPSEVTEEMLRLANEGENPNLRPAVILNYNINPLKITECTSCIVNDSWAPKIKELLENGWTMFRVQTEFYGSIGHRTMAYFAKIKDE
jgi:hypothetical protein